MYIVDRLNQWLTLAANVGVIAGIMFLAYEIRVNTDAVRSSNYAAYNEVSAAWGALTAEHAGDLAAIMQESFDELTPEERLIFAGWGSVTLSQAEALYLHHRAGLLEDDVFEARMNTVAMFMIFNPGLFDAWQKGMVGAEIGEFKEHIAARVATIKSSLPDQG